MNKGSAGGEVIPKGMDAIVYRGARKLCLERIPVPEIRAGEILVRVAACGVCPTDIKKIHYGTVPGPRVFGHETAGTVVKLGAEVKGFRIGDRVALHHHVPCGRCHACRHRAFAQCPTYKKTGITAGFEPAGGGYAEYVRVMNFVLPGVVKIPKRNSFEEGALLEPVNTVWKAIEKLRLLKGDSAIVFGQGPIGLLFTKLFELSGVRVLAVDLLEARLKLAKKFGARGAFVPSDPKLPKAALKISGRRGADAAVIAVSSNDAILSAQSLVRGGAPILLFAHTKRGDRAAIDLSTVCVDENDLLGSYSSDWTLQSRVARLVFSRKLDVRPLITHRFPLAQTADAIELAAHPTEQSLKVIVTHGAEF